MNKVKRAVILAAGKGERLRPVTLEVPKPLVRIHGVRMIDTIIHGLEKNGIGEVYIVTGYKKEQFYGLEKEYPGVSLIENPYYGTCNNISSLYMARDHLEDAIILDGDQFICNPDILMPEFERSGYQAVWTGHETKEWLLEVKDGLITGCRRAGGERGWQLASISYWDAEDGKRLKRHLEVEFEKKQNHQIYWDDIPMFCYPEQYCLEARPMQAGDMAEVDTLEDLIKLDPVYEKYLLKEGHVG